MLWTVIDEAQQGVELYTEYLCSDSDTKVARPVLGVMVNTVLRRYDFISRMVVSGTGLSMRDATSTRSSSSVKPGEMVTQTPYGLFDDRTLHEKWLLEHFAIPGNSWMLRPEENPEHKRLVDRNLKWLPGRYVEYFFSSRLSSRN